MELQVAIVGAEATTRSAEPMGFESSFLSRHYGSTQRRLRYEAGPADDHSNIAGGA